MPHMEEPNQVLYIRLVRAYTYAVDVNRSQHVLQLVEPLRTRAAVLVPEFLAGRIDKNDLPSLGVGKFNQSRPGQCNLGPVANRDRDNIVTLVEKAKRFLESGLNKI